MTVSSETLRLPVAKDYPVPNGFTGEVNGVEIGSNRTNGSASPRRVNGMAHITARTLHRTDAPYSSAMPFT